MDSTKVQWAGKKRNTPSYIFECLHFRLTKSNLGKLSSIGHEKGVERILRQVCELQYITKEELSINKRQFEGISQQKISHRIVCWTYKCLGHFSKDCNLSVLGLGILY
jgi:hypothetical protein